MSGVKLRNVIKRYGDTQVIDELDDFNVVEEEAQSFAFGQHGSASMHAGSFSLFSFCQLPT